MTLAFDCDWTLRGDTDAPLYENVNLLLFFARRGFRILIWSGGGEDYARSIARSLGLLDLASKEGWDLHVAAKCRESAEKWKPDISFDDCLIDLATVNVRLKHPSTSADEPERW